jgi:hypothetical protein
MAEFRTLHVSFKEYCIDHSSKDQRIQIPLVVSVRNMHPSSVEMRVSQAAALKAHIERLLAPATVMDCWQMPTETCGKPKRSMTGKANRPPRIDDTPSCSQQANLVAHLACAVLEGSKILLDDKVPKVSWSDNLERHKPNGTYPDLSELRTQCEVYGHLTSHRLRQNCILKGFLYLAGSSCILDGQKRSRSYNKLAKILISVINNLSHAHGDSAYNVCAAIAGKARTYIETKKRD